MGVLGCSCNLPALLTFAVLVGITAYVASHLEFNPVVVHSASPPKFEGALAVNDVLENAEKLLPGKLRGPESVAFYKGKMYTGLGDGRIVRIVGEKITTVLQTGTADACDKQYNEQTCGRPLGLRFGHKDDLYVADCYYGLLRVNVTTGDVRTLYAASSPINGRVAKLIDDLDISKEGDIYFSDASSKYWIHEALLDVGEGRPNGRLLHFDPRTQTTEELLSDLHFANGVQLSPTQDFLLFCETHKSRVMKYHLKGSKKGSVEVFAENLPGFPDNIRANSRGGYWVGLCGSRLPDVTTSSSYLGPRPWLRKAIAHTVYVLMRFFANVDKLIPNEFSRNLAHNLPHLSSSQYLLPAHGLIVELNWKGEVARSMHAPSGRVNFISHVEEHEGHLYLGSPWNDYIGKVKL